MTDTTDTQETEDDGMPGWFPPLCLVIVVLALVGCITLVLLFAKPETNAEKALDSYRAAVKLCGADNVDSHEYTNGTKDFDCSDYSEIK